MTETSSTEAVSIANEPKAGQWVQHAETTYKTIREGNAYILEPQLAKSSLDVPTKAKKDAKQEGGKPKADDSTRQQVFYNPIQQFNRDLSVLAIRAFAEDYNDIRERKNKQRYEGRAKRPLKRKRGAEVAAASHEPQHTQQQQAQETATEESKKALAGEPGVDKMQIDNEAPATLDRENTAGMPDQLAVTVDIVSNDQSKELKPDLPVQRSSDNAIKILDALSATGLRALRYASELPFDVAVTANDLSKSATDAIAINVEHNKAKDRIKTATGDARKHMYDFVSLDNTNDKKRYHVIDLDPYGSAVPFLDSAIHAIQDHGLLCVTCTDTSIFNSPGYLEKTYSQYGGTPIKGSHAHEGGLRLILHAIATAAGRNHVSIEPLLSLSIDFYARVFVRVHRSPAEVKLLAGKQMIVYNCDTGCGSWQTQYLARNEATPNKSGNGTFMKHKLAQAPTASEHCPHCGFKTHLSGPMYGGPLHNPAFIERILSYLPDLDKEVYGTTARIEGMLQTAYEELLLDSPKADNNPDSTDKNSAHEKAARKTSEVGDIIPRADAALIDHHPFYFSPSGLSGILHVSAPSDAAIKGALRHMGYRATRTHCKPGMIKTDAPWSVIWHVMRQWVEEHPIKEGALSNKNAGYHILHPKAKPDLGEETSRAAKSVVFDEQLGRDKVAKKLVRYQENPRADWGPMNRAKAW